MIFCRRKIMRIISLWSKIDSPAWFAKFYILKPITIGKLRNVQYGRAHHLSLMYPKYCRTAYSGMFRFKMPARRPRRGTPKLSGLLFFNYFPGSTAMIKRMMMSALFLGAPLTLCAAPDSAPDGMMSLSAQASAQVPQDVVHITLFHEQQANTAAPLTAALKQKTDQALREARAQKQVAVHTGTLAVYPSTNRDGRITGWRGRTELVLESNHFEAAAKLAGKLTSILQIGDVRFSLSPKASRAAQQSWRWMRLRIFASRRSLLRKPLVLAAIRSGK